MLSVLKATAAPKRRRGRPALTAEVVEARRQEEARQKARQKAQAAVEAAPTPVEQVRAAFTRGSRLSAFVGLVLGGFVPLASYTLIHVEVAERPQLWGLVAGGLIYSAISVYTWARMAFHYWAKALGFVVLLEGILTFCHVAWLSLFGLAILMVLNGATAAVTLQSADNAK